MPRMGHGRLGGVMKMLELIVPIVRYQRNRMPLRLIIFAVAAFATLSCSICEAQIYETPETRRQQAEAQRQEQEQKKKEAEQLAKRSLEKKEAQAEGYVGKAFWYLPSATPGRRLSFYEKIPPSSHSEDPNFLFRPLTKTSFVVTGVIMPPPIMYPAGKDEYLLEIKFPDGKVGYVNVVGCCGIIENLNKGELSANTEYIATEPAEEILARRAREKQLAKERVEREEQLAKERAEREERAAQEKGAEEYFRRDAIRRAAQEKAETERKRLEAISRAAREKAETERKRREALPSPRIGMTREQVINQTRWGKPYDVNRTTTARGTREQWVYGDRRYLYFDNGILTTIQD